MYHVANTVVGFEVGTYLMVCFSFPDSVCKHFQICCQLCAMLSTFNFNWHVIFVEIPLAE